MLTTAGRLMSALNDRRYLAQAEARGRVHNVDVTKRLVRSGVRRECVRMFKHLVTIVAISLSYTHPADTYGDVARFVELRNWLACSVALALMFNSVLDYFAQRWAMRYFHHGHYRPLVEGDELREAIARQAEVKQ